MKTKDTQSIKIKTDIHDVLNKIKADSGGRNLTDIVDELIRIGLNKSKYSKYAKE